MSFENLIASMSVTLEKLSRNQLKKDVTRIVNNAINNKVTKRINKMEQRSDRMEKRISKLESGGACRQPDNGTMNEMSADFLKAR